MGSTARRALVRRAWAPLVELAAVVVTFLEFGHDHKADLAVFLTAGNQVLQGVSPYEAVTSPDLLGGHAFVYPWAAAFLFAPLAALPTWLAGDLFTLGSIGAVVLGSRWLNVPRGWGVAALVLCAPFARNMELGAVNAFFFLLLAALWRWRERTWVVAGAVTLLIGVKLFLAPLVVWVLLTRSRRCIVTTGASLASWFAFSFAVGPLSVPTYFDMLRRLSDFMGHRGMGFESAIARISPDAPARAIAAAVLVLGTVACVGTYYRSTRRSEAGLLAALVVLSVISSPMLWRHYLLLPFFALALLSPKPTRLVAACLASWVVVGCEAIAPFGNLPLDQRLLLLHVGLFGLLIAAVGQNARSRTGGPAPVIPAQPSGREQLGELGSGLQPPTGGLRGALDHVGDTGPAHGVEAHRGEVSR